MRMTKRMLDLINEQDRQYEYHLREAERFATRLGNDPSPNPADFTRVVENYLMASGLAHTIQMLHTGLSEEEAADQGVHWNENKRQTYQEARFWQHEQERRMPRGGVALSW